ARPYGPLRLGLPPRRPPAPVPGFRPCSNSPVPWLAWGLVNFVLPPEDDPRRLEVRVCLDEHPNPSGRELADSDYVVPHWPKPWGLDADPLTQLIIEDELKRAKVQKPINPIGTGHCGPILVMHGTEEQ